jgi:hypothetical protein
MKKAAFLLFLLIFSGALGAQTSSPDSSNSSYLVENIALPPGLEAETGGLAFFPDGRLAACFTRGEVMIYNPKNKQWQLFAEGLHEPLGILVEDNSTMVVLQRPELTRIKDTDGDGKADIYENINDDFGISGNYHEFNYGPVKDRDGNFFLALNTASSGGGIRSNPRGTLNLLGRDGADGRRQMYSVVPFRGWVVKITPTGELLPFASGFRSPNGIGLDLNGNLFVADNQSDWVETSALHHVQENKFYGHPASLIWKEGWDKGNPFDLPIEVLDNMRTKAAVLFPHGIIANSPSEPVIVNTTEFGPFEGQFLVGEMNRERIVRVMLEYVDGQFQGACIPFLDNQGLKKGNNRMAFAPDGSLWVGQIAHGWLGDQGIQKITYTGTLPMDIYKMNLTAEGFEITFTQAVDVTEAMKIDNYQFTHYRYDYKKKPYDEPVDQSNQSDIKAVPVTEIKLSEDLKTVAITLPELKTGYVYELKLNRITSQSGAALDNSLICYTLNKLLSEKAEK